MKVMIELTDEQVLAAVKQIIGNMSGKDWGDIAKKVRNDELAHDGVWPTNFLVELACAALAICPNRYFTNGWLRKQCNFDFEQTDRCLRALIKSGHIVRGTRGSYRIV